MSKLEEVQEEELTVGQDDTMPQLISQVSSPYHEQEQDDAVILKNPRVLATQDSTSEESTAAEEIVSDYGTELTEDASPQYTSPSEDSNVEYLESTQTKGTNKFRLSQSLELKEDLVKRALGTFSISNPFKNLSNREQG